MRGTTVSTRAADQDFAETQRSRINCASKETFAGILTSNLAAYGQQNSINDGKAKPLPQTTSHAGLTYKVNKANQQFVTTIHNRKNLEILRIEQADYDLGCVVGKPAYIQLNPTQSNQLRALYVDCDRRPMIDLLNGAEPPIVAGTITFRARCEQLFAGTIQTI